MFSIRPFKENDNEKLLEIEELCPQGNDSSAMGVKKMDIIARYRMYDDWKVMVAEEDGEIAGWIGWTVKRAGDQDEPYVYLVEVMVHPKFRRRGIAAKLVEEAERNARQASCSHIYCCIYEHNDASKALFNGLDYSSVANVKTCAIPAYKKANVPQNFSIGHVGKEEISEVLDLINRHYKSYRHFVPYTKESFASHLEKIPEYGSDNFWALKDQGKIAACGGLWDCSVLADQCYAREPLSWKLMGSLFRFLGLFMKVPKIAREGEYSSIISCWKRRETTLWRSLTQTIKSLSPLGSSSPRLRLRRYLLNPSMESCQNSAPFTWTSEIWSSEILRQKGFKGSKTRLGE